MEMKIQMLPLIGISLCALYSVPVCAAADAPQEVVEAHLDNDGVQRARIVGGEYFFRPRRVVIKVNVPVELLVAKTPGIVPHTFVINAPQAGIMVDQELESEPRKIAFTPTAAGTYPFYCRNRLLFFKSHRERGMEGVLEVKP
jgi:plastocyanin